MDKTPSRRPEPRPANEGEGWPPAAGRRSRTMAKPTGFPPPALWNRLWGKSLRAELQPQQPKNSRLIGTISSTISKVNVFNHHAIIHHRTRSTKPISRIVHSLNQRRITISGLRRQDTRSRIRRDFHKRPAHQLMCTVLMPQKLNANPAEVAFVHKTADMLTQLRRSELTAHPKIAGIINKRSTRTDNITNMIGMINVELNALRQWLFPSRRKQHFSVPVEGVIAQNDIELTRITQARSYDRAYAFL